jgi:hypothetical protein
MASDRGSCKLHSARLIYHIGGPYKAHNTDTGERRLGKTGFRRGPLLEWSGDGAAMVGQRRVPAHYEREAGGLQEAVLRIEQFYRQRSTTTDPARLGALPTVAFSMSASLCWLRCC